MKRLIAALLCLMLVAPALAEEEPVWTEPTWVVPEGYEDLISGEPGLSDYVRGMDSVIWDKPGLREITLPASMDEEAFGQFMVEARALVEEFWYDTYIYLDDEERGAPIPDYYAPGFALEKIHIAPTHKTLCSIDGVVFTKDKKTLLACPMGRKGSYTVPDGVEAIAENAFRACDSLEKIALPKTLKTIGRRAFEKAGGLKTINIPKGVCEIGEWAFSNCIALESLALPDGCEVSEGALRYLFALKTLFVGADVTFKEGTIWARGEELRYTAPDTVVYCKEGSEASVAAAVAQLKQAELGNEPELLKSPRFLYDNPAILKADYGDLSALDTVNILAKENGMARVDFCGEEMEIPLDLLALADPYAGFERLLEMRIYGDRGYGIGEEVYVEPRWDAPTEGVKYPIYDIIQRYGTWFVLEQNGKVFYTPAKVNKSNFAANSVVADLRVLTVQADLIGVKGEVLQTFYPGEQMILDRYETPEDTPPYEVAYVRMGGMEGRLFDAEWEDIEEESFMPGF